VPSRAKRTAAESKTIGKKKSVLHKGRISATNPPRGRRRGAEASKREKERLRRPQKRREAEQFGLRKFRRRSEQGLSAEGEAQEANCVLKRRTGKKGGVFKTTTNRVWCRSRSRKGETTTGTQQGLGKNHTTPKRPMSRGGKGTPRTTPTLSSSSARPGASHKKERMGEGQEGKEALPEQ